MLVHYQQAFTGAAFDYATLGNARCGSIRVDTTTCLAFNDCVPTPGHMYFNNESNRTEATTYYILPIAMGPSTLANPSCPSSSIVAAAVVEGDMPFVTVPIYRYAAFAGNSFSNSTHLTISIVEPNSAAIFKKILTLVAPSSFDETAIPQLARGAGGFAAAHCSIPDVASFERTAVDSSDDLGTKYSSECTYSSTSATGADLASACLADDLCVALTTSAAGSPLCLLRSGRGVDPYRGMDGRWLMQKTTANQRTCSANLANSGTLTVLLRQTSFASSTAVVFIGTAVAAQCGGLKPFAGGLFGRSSACGMWMVCHVGRVHVNDTVRVVASATTTAGGCDGSVGVLFDITFDAVDLTRPPEPRIPSSLSTSSLRQTFPHRLFINNARRSFVNVFAYDLQRLVLDVAQTGYDCSLTQAGYCARPAVQLLVGTRVIQQCGGTSPFLPNLNGSSNDCAQPRFCGMPVFIGSKNHSAVTSGSSSGSDGSIMQSAASSLFADGSSAASGVLESSGTNTAGYIGWIRLNVDIAAIRYASSLCPYFAATLFASCNTSNTNISGFLLHGGSGGEFAVLAAPRVGSVIANITRTMPHVLPLPTIQTELGHDDARIVHLVNATAYLQLLDQARVGVNASFACVMDWISGASGSCVVPVPRGANFVTIRVAQTNFASSANVMTIVQIGVGASSVLSTTSCGGTLGFAGLPSMSEQCATFLPCGSGFLDAFASSIQINVPSVIGNSATCTVAFAATVDFQFVNRTVPAVCPFLCVGDRTCVPQSAVCNGVVDCSDGSDEANCNAWTKIESAAIFTLTSDTLLVAIHVFADCRTAALKNGTSLFAVSRNQSVCILYSSNRAELYLTDPSLYILPAPNFVMFAMLPVGMNYGRCTSENSCSGNGQVIASRSGGKLACTCVCSTGFTGSDCSSRMALGTQGPVVVSFSTGDVIPTPSQVEAALTLLSNSTDTSIFCSPLVNENGKLLATCTVSGTAADVSAINAAVATDAARKTVASALNISFSSLDPMTPSTQPLFQPASCGASGTGDGASVSCAAGGKPIQSIKVAVTASSGLSEIVLNLGHSSQSQSQQERHFTSAASSSRLTCVPDNNNIYETPTRSGCVTTVCFVSISNPVPVDAVTVSIPNYGGNASSDPCYSAGLEFTVPLLISDVVRAFPAKANDNFSSFLISGIVVLVIGGLLLGAASCALRMHIAETYRAVGTVETEHKLKSILTTAIRKMRFNQNRNTKAERWSAGFAVASFDLLILGIFLALYFVNSTGYTSNVEVLIENYRTNQCDQSTFASLASRVTIITAATSRGCLLRESTGVAGGSIYAAAHCDNSTGVLSILVKIGSSMSDCNAMPFTAFAAGSCVPTSQLLLSHINDSSYMLFQCGTTQSVEARFAAFQALNADSPDIDDTRPQPPSASTSQISDRFVTDRSTSVSYFVANRVAQAAVTNVTSTAWNRFESAAASGAFVAGDSSPKRLVVQLDSELFEDDTLGAATSLIENAFPLKGVGNDAAALGPLDGDYPAGFLFNNFNLPGEAALFDAGPGAARYYGIRGSAADIGQHYQSGERKGFTISMYLRCSRSTAGLAFAVADAREDMRTSMSPLIVRLMTMLANGSPGSAWYNSTYNVYSGLFVDGPAAALRFVYANPNTQSPDSALIDLQWDLTALGLLRLFNNLWHHVAIIIRTENENTKVQLVVDGVTSLSQNGWNLCPQRTPLPVQPLDPTVNVAVRNFQVERVLTDGVLFTGYFNGGVAHLEFRNEKVELFDLWRLTTRAIQAHNAINTKEYIVLGSLLLSIGVIMLGMMLATSGREWMQERETRRREEGLRAHEVYAGLWRKAPKDPNGHFYTPLPWELALGCMGYDVKIFAIFLEELRFNFSHPSEELVRLLYAKSTAGTGPVNSRIAPPTAEEWNFLADQQQEDDLVAEARKDEEEGVVERYDSSKQLHRVDTTATLGDTEESISPIASFRVKSERSLRKVNWSPKVSNAGQTTSLVAVVCNDAQQEQQQLVRSAREKIKEEKKDIKVDRQEVKINKNSVPSAFKGPVGKNLSLLRGGGGGNAGGRKEKEGGEGSQSSSKQKRSDGGGELAKSPSLSELVQTVLTVIQSVSVWQTSLPFPTAHLAAFHSAFAAFSLDITAMISISPLVTPLVQLFVGLVVFGVLLFVVESDEKAFLWNLARYVVVRDSQDLGVPQEEVRNRVEGDYMSEVTSDFDSLLGEVPDNGLLFTVPLLPLHQSQKIDDFVSGNRRLPLAMVRAVMIHDTLHRNITLQKPPGARDKCPIAYLNVKCTDAVPAPLRELGHCCALHVNRVLGPQVQTSVWPYKYRPSCCVETHGHRCGESVGKMFVCGERGENRSDPVQCKYAVCEKHFRAPLSVKLLNPAVGMYRAAMNRGALWFIVAVFLLLANACYTPFMKTALMVLACDPYYQCQFQHCWEAPDRLFILAAYLCLVIVTFYGVGFPLSMAFLLHRRKMMLNEIFFSQVYGGRFKDESEGPRTVDKAEWGRFVVTDPTALGKLYLSFELEWIYVPPILLFWKAAILAPAVFIERETFQQLAGVAAAQFLFGLFLFVTEPSISPVVDLMYKLGAAHQMLLLGVLSLNRRQLYVGSTDLGPLSVGITATYLVVCLGIFIGITLMPVLKKSLDQRRVVRLFESLGMHYSQAISMHVVPLRQPLFTEVSSVPYYATRSASAATSTGGIMLDQSPTTSVSQLDQKDVQDNRPRSRAASAVNLLGVQSEEMVHAQAVLEDQQETSSAGSDVIVLDTTDANNPFGADSVFSDADKFSDPGGEDEGDRPIELSDELVRGFVETTKSDTLTALQRRMLLEALAGKDCFVSAPTSGKSTAAVIIALQCIMHHLDAVQVVVVCKGAEEAAAFAEQARQLGRHMNGGLPFVKLFDGTNRAAVDITELQIKPHEARIVVGSTRSLARLVARSALNMFHTAHFIIDDAAATLAPDKDEDDTNVNRVHGMLRLLSAKAKVMMLMSSTLDMTEEVRVTAMLFMKQIAEITSSVPLDNDRYRSDETKPLPLTQRDLRRLQLHSSGTISNASGSQSFPTQHDYSSPRASPGMNSVVDETHSGSRKISHGESLAAAGGDLERHSSIRLIGHVADVDVEFEVPE